MKSAFARGSLASAPLAEPELHQRDAFEHARISFPAVGRPQDRFRYDRDVGRVHWFWEGRDGSFKRGGHDLDHLGRKCRVRKILHGLHRPSQRRLEGTTSGRTGSSYFVGGCWERVDQLRP